MVSAAASVFARQGYDQTTMQDLARQLGLATGALYHYFGSKEQLLMAICDAADRADPGPRARGERSAMSPPPTGSARSSGCGWPM